MVLTAALAGTGVANADLTFADWESGISDSAAVFDAWSQAGNAWTSGSQPRFNEEEHILLSNDREPGHMATLESGFGPGGVLNPHLWGHYFYTGFSSGTFVLSPSSVAPQTTLIMMAIVYTGAVSPSPVLHYGSSNLASATEMVGNPGESIVVEDPYESIDYTTQFRVFTWDVSELEQADTFTISFSFPTHVAFSNIIVAQVPEPAAGLLLVGGLVAGAAYVGRRRTRCR